MVTHQQSHAPNKILEAPKSTQNWWKHVLADNSPNTPPTSTKNCVTDKEPLRLSEDVIRTCLQHILLLLWIFKKIEVWRLALGYPWFLLVNYNTFKNFHDGRFSPVNNLEIILIYVMTCCKGHEKNAAIRFFAAENQFWTKCHLQMKSRNAIQILDKMPFDISRCRMAWPIRTWPRNKKLYSYKAYLTYHQRSKYMTQK